MKKIMLLVLACLPLLACSSGDSAVTAGQGFVALQVEAAQDFNPNVVHGEIEQYRVEITGEKLPMSVVRYFPAGTASASFDGFPAGADILITVEYINPNGLVVRRGRSQSVHIASGQTTHVSIPVNNVPIFANVRDGATVAADRFVPKVFAPGGITFQISDAFDGNLSVLSDQVSGETALSISATDASSLATFHAPELIPGPHELTVVDPDSGESSTVNVNIVAPGVNRALTTTAGGYAGTILGTERSSPWNVLSFVNQSVDL